jgi:hypothetical protein
MKPQDLDELWSLLLAYRNSDLLSSGEKEKVQMVLNMVTISNEVAQTKERARLSHVDDYDDDSEESSDEA